MEREVYRLKINKDEAKDNPEIGVNEIAHTKNPALELKGFYFNKKQKNLQFTDEYKMRVVAPAIIPDIEIFRRDKEEDREYYVTFTTEDIEIMVENFMSKGGVNKFNDEHTEKKPNSFILESWIIETENDKAYDKYNFDREELPIGSFMVISQITDKEYFEEEIIGNDKTGFSIEGFFEEVLEMNSNLNLELKNTQDDGSKNKKEEMNIHKFELDGKFYTADEEGKLVLLSEDEDKLDKDKEKEEDLKEEDLKEEDKLESDKEEDEDKEDLKEDLKEDKEEDKLEEDEESDNDTDTETDTEVYTKEEIDTKIENLMEIIAKIESSMESKDEDKEEDEEMSTKLSKVSKSVDEKTMKVMNLSKLFY